MHAFGNKRSKWYALMLGLLLIPVMAGTMFFQNYSSGLRTKTESIGTSTMVDDPLDITPYSLATMASTPIVTSSPTPAVCRDHYGSIEYRELLSDYFQAPLSVRIYLPPCYNFDTGKHYPVLYVLHGQSSNDDQWDRLGLDEMADELILEGKIIPLIIVMPREPNLLANENESKFGETVTQALIPWIDEEYRTINTRECRAIGGLSRGAAWAMRIGFVNWELFNAIGTHSFAPFSGDFYNFPYWLQEIPDEQIPRVYMDMGTQDFMLNPASLFEDRLTKYHVAHEWIINNGTHNEEYWKNHVEDYLLWYTFPWEEDCMYEEAPSL